MGRGQKYILYPISFHVTIVTDGKASEKRSSYIHLLFIHHSSSIHHHTIDNMCSNRQPPFHSSISRPSSSPSFFPANSHHPLCPLRFLAPPPPPPKFLHYDSRLIATSIPRTSPRSSNSLRIRVAPNFQQFRSKNWRWQAFSRCRQRIRV